MDYDFNSYYEYKIPSRDDKRYKEIESFELYQLRNNVIFEILIRSKRYKELTKLKTKERIQTAVELGFNENDARYAGLPWGIFRIIIKEDFNDKNGLPFDMKMMFRYLISEYKNDDDLLFEEKINSLDKIFTYFTLKKEEPLDSILTEYSHKDEYLFENITDGYCMLVSYYLNTCGKASDYRILIEKGFKKLMSYCSRNTDYLLQDIIENNNEKTIENIFNVKTDKEDYFIRDIKNGLDRLISYYIDQKKVFTTLGTQVKTIPKNVILNNKGNCVLIFGKDHKGKKDNFLMLLIEEEQNFNKKEEIEILRKKVSDIKKFKFKKLSKIKMILSLDDSIHLNNIDAHFKKDLTLLDFKETTHHYSLLQARPNIKFNETNIVNIQVNMNLPEKEFLEYMKKIKNSYDKDNKILKNINRLINPKLSNKHELLTVKRKIADSFFCYDYYSARLRQVTENNNYHEMQMLKEELEIIEKHNSYTTEEKNIQISFIKNSMSKIKERQEITPSINKKSKHFIFKEPIFRQYNINPSTAYGYYSDIIELLRKLKYSDS